MTTIFWVLFLYCLLERLAELLLSRRNQRRMKSDGFSEKESVIGLRVMVGIHAGWYLSTATEALLQPRPPPLHIQEIALAAFLLAQILRVWTLKTLGTFWNISVVTTDNDRPKFVSTGPYRFIRHPNYLVVIVEILTLPLVGGCPLTALVFTMLNGLVLYRRVRLEETCLIQVPDYLKVMGDKGRFIPRVCSRIR